MVWTKHNPASRQRKLFRPFKKKKERENTTNKRKNDITQIIPQERIKENTSNGNIKKYKSESEIDNDEDSVKYVATSKSHKPGKYIKTTVLNNDLYSNSTSNGTELFDSENSDGLIIKNNKGKILGKYGLKIESRLQSVNNLKKDYQMRKSIIQEALSRVDSGPKNKIIFNDTEEGNRSSKRHLFKRTNLKTKRPKLTLKLNDIFKEKMGKSHRPKLLALQSKYKSDKRFVLDSRFVENDEENNKAGNTEENELDDLGEEKQKEYEILEQVLEKKVSKPVRNDSERTVKAMLRFDPSQPDHSKFEIQNGVRKEKKRKRDKSVADALSKKKKKKRKFP
ncbi:hypothetical protein NQ317_012034 [Molorchus minor]|uniref:Uncharacterized protein n=1 Tax=Molorchus minor TaxID=1323400 RepID=A0ABQ9IZY9_9CUCU|nr:hypothetical protein NQ317_012034 [Molorchus minor]